MPGVIGGRRYLPSEVRVVRAADVEWHTLSCPAAGMTFVIRNNGTGLRCGDIVLRRVSVQYVHITYRHQMADDVPGHVRRHG